MVITATGHLYRCLDFKHLWGNNMSPVNAFISYAHADEKALERLRKHFAMLQREGSLNAWTDNAIVPGAKLDPEIDANLKSSSIFIALLSPDYLASKYCYETEFKQALALADGGKLRIVPVILEPCDWLSSPFKDFMALPKDGQPVSSWTNQNNAFLDVVTGLRRLLQTLTSAPSSVADHSASNISAGGKRPRIKQDFDSIQKADYADKAYETIQNYFRASCEELSKVGDSLRAKFETIDGTAFTCTVVNRAKISGGEAHITVRNSKGRQYFGDISYSYQRYAQGNSANGSYSVEADDYNLFLTSMSTMGGSRNTKFSPEQAAEELWNDFVKRAGIEYE